MSSDNILLPAPYFLLLALSPNWPGLSWPWGQNTTQKTAIKHQKNCNGASVSSQDSHIVRWTFINFGFPTVHHTTLKDTTFYITPLSLLSRLLFIISLVNGFLTKFLFWSQELHKHEGAYLQLENWWTLVSWASLSVVLVKAWEKSSWSPSGSLETRSQKAGRSLEEAWSPSALPDTVLRLGMCQGALGAVRGGCSLSVEGVEWEQTAMEMLTSTFTFIGIQVRGGCTNSF